MKRMQRGFAPIVIFIVAGIVLVLGGAYAYFHFRHAATPEAAAPASSAAELENASTKAAAEQAKFDGLANTFKSERPANSAFLDLYAKLAALSQKAAVEAVAAPKTVSAPDSSAFRTSILSRIEVLQQRRDFAVTHDIGPVAINEMLDDAKYLKSHLEAIGGDQSDIDTVQGIIDSLDAVANIPPPNPPKVSDADIAAELAALQEAKAKLAVLESQQGDVLPSDNGSTQGGGDQAPQNVPPQDPITVHSGPPKLIEGTNKD